MPKLTYLGHSAFLLTGAGTALVIDPFLTGNPVAAKSAREIKVDWVILTHGHGDHLGDGLEIQSQSRHYHCTFRIGAVLCCQGCRNPWDAHRR